MEWRPGTGIRKRKNITRDHCFTRLQVQSSSADPRFLRMLEANALRTKSKAQAGSGFGKLNRFNASGAVSRSWSKLQMLTRTLKRDTCLLLGQDENENVGSYAESSREQMKLLEEMEALIESEENAVNMQASSKAAGNRFRTLLDICTCNKRRGDLCSCSAFPSPIANVSKVTTTNGSFVTQQPAREEPGLTTDKFADFPERAKEKRLFRRNIQEALERDKLTLEEFLEKQRQDHASREGPAEVDHNHLESFFHRNVMQSDTVPTSSMSDEAGRTENCQSLSVGRLEQTSFEKDSCSIFQECTGRLSMDTAKLQGTINKLLDKNKQLQNILCGRKDLHDHFSQVEVSNPFQLSALDHSSASSKSTVVPHSTESQCPQSERTSTTEGVELMTEVEACTTLYLGYRHTDDCGDFPHGYSYLYASPAFEENMDPNIHLNTSCKCCSKPKAQVILRQEPDNLCHKFKLVLAPACCDSWTQTSDWIVASVSTELIPSSQTGSWPFNSEDGHCPADDGPYHVNIPHVRMSTGTRQEAGGEHYVRYNVNLEHLEACPSQSTSQTAEKREEESVAGHFEIISAQKGEAVDVPKSNESSLERSFDAQLDALHDLSLRCQDSVGVFEKEAKPSDDGLEKLEVTESLLKQNEKEVESLQNEINKIKSELAQSHDKIEVLEQALATKELDMEQITHSGHEARVHALQVERNLNAKVEEAKHAERNKCREQFQSTFEILRRELFSSLESIVSLKQVVGEKQEAILELEAKIKAMEAAKCIFDSRQAAWEEKVTAGERTIAHVNSLLEQHNRMLEERLAERNVQVERMETRLQEMENAEAISKKCQAILALQLEEAKRSVVEMAQALESERRSGLSALASNNAKFELTEASKAVVEVHADMLTEKKMELSMVKEEAEKETTRKPQAQANKMQDDFVSIELENFRLKGHIKESDRQLEDQKRQLSELMSINEDLLEFARAKENELVYSHRKIADLQQILHDKAEENTVLMQQMEDLQNQTQAAFMKDRYQTPMQAVVDTNYEVSQRDKIIERLTKRLAGADGDYEVRQRDEGIERLTKRLADYEVSQRNDVVERLTKRLAAALETEDTLRKEAEQLHALLKTSQFKEHEVNEQVSRLRMDKQDLEETVRSLERKTMLFRQQTASLRKIVEDKDRELRVLHKDLEQLRAREQILEEDILEKEGQIAILKESFADDVWLQHG